MENKFKSGDIVCAKVNPTTPLKVRVFARKFYYCDVLDQPDEKEKVYFAREIKFYNTKDQILFSFLEMLANVLVYDFVAYFST